MDYYDIRECPECGADVKVSAMVIEHHFDTRNWGMLPSWSDENVSPVMDRPPLCRRSGSRYDRG